MPLITFLSLKTPLGFCNSFFLIPTLNHRIHLLDSNKLPLLTVFIKNGFFDSYKRGKFLICWIHFLVQIGLFPYSTTIFLGKHPAFSHQLFDKSLVFVIFIKQN